MVINIHPTKLVFEDVPDNAAELLSDTFSFEIPGFFFAQKTHKKKHPVPQKWCSFCQSDGKRNLYNQGTMHLGFLNQVKKLLVEAGFEYTLIDHRPPVPPKQYDWHCSAGERVYQQTLLKSMMREGQGIVQAATGGGKTVLCAAAICELGLPAMIVVPTKLLMGQFQKAFEEFTDIPVGCIGSGKYVDAPVQIAIAKSLVKEDWSVHPDLMKKQVLCIDEMHYSSAKTWETIITNCPARYRFGFSATPKKDTELEQALLAGMCGDVIGAVGVADLQKEGYLCQTDIRILNIKCGYDRMVYDDTLKNGQEVGWRECYYQEMYRKAVVENEYGNEVVGRVIAHHANQGQKVLVIVQALDHAAFLAEQFQQDYIFLSGNDTAKQTEAKRLQFREQEGGICIGTSVVDTGMDVPSIDVLVLVAGGDFDGRAIQRLGRGLRPSPGKDTVIVYDIRYNDKPMFWYHGLSRIKAYESIGQQVKQYDSFDEVIRAELKQRQESQ